MTEVKAHGVTLNSRLLDVMAHGVTLNSRLLDVIAHGDTFNSSLLDAYVILITRQDTLHHAELT